MATNWTPEPSMLRHQYLDNAMTELNRASFCDESNHTQTAIALALLDIGITLRKIEQHISADRAKGTNHDESPQNTQRSS